MCKNTERRGQSREAEEEESDKDGYILLIDPVRKWTQTNRGLERRSKLAVNQWKATIIIMF